MNHQKISRELFIASIGWAAGSILSTWTTMRIANRTMVAQRDESQELFDIIVRFAEEAPTEVTERVLAATEFSQELSNAL